MIKSPPKIQTSVTSSVFLVLSINFVDTTSMIFIIIIIIIISFADTFTSLLAGTIIFSILGHLAYTLDQPVDQVSIIINHHFFLLQVVKSGAGLAFVSYPEVLAKFDFAPQVRKESPQVILSAFFSVFPPHIWIGIFQLKIEQWKALCPQNDHENVWQRRLFIKDGNRPGRKNTYLHCRWATHLT